MCIRDSPCLVGVYIGMFLMATQLQLPGVLKSTVTYIGNCNSALTMFIIGTILTLSLIHISRQPAAP